jgi:hypothetical protein
MPSTGRSGAEREVLRWPRGSSCVLYDTYNTFCTIHIRNVLNATNEWASVVCILYKNLASVVCRKVQVVQSLFLPFPLSVYPWREDPTSEKIRNVLNATNEWALEYVGQYRWFNPSFYPSLCRISMARRPHQREDPTTTLPKVDPTMTLSPYIHGEKTSKAPEQASTGPGISSPYVIEGCTVDSQYLDATNGPL